MAMADFGQPRYGGSLLGQLVYPASQGGYNPYRSSMKCYPEDCEYGCSAFNESVPPFQIQREPGRFYVMLLDRGPRNMEGHKACYFLDKVYNAQLAGADAVIVANDVPGDLSTAVAPEADATARKELEELSISAAMVSLEDGQLLKTLLRVSNVTVMLNWTSVVPPSSTVKWELWTTTNDMCGSCKDRTTFLRGIKDKAIALEKAGKLAFSPHYLMWSCPPEFLNTTECASECFHNGTYCVPEPDKDATKGPSGRDVLKMNLRALCFFRLAAAAGNGALWWDYALRFADQCTTANNTFNTECATRVFDSLNGASLAANNTGREVWDKCSFINETAGSGEKIQLLEDEILAQRGNASQGISSASIDPTIRINGKQYRGSLQQYPVLRALCAGFPAGQEPPECNSAAVSEDECAPGGVGERACMSSESKVAGKTKCINTFAGYKCDCSDGMIRYTNPDTGEERCEDVNECLATNVPLTYPNCSCSRCACINRVGSFGCTGPLDNQCTADNHWGNCWQQEFTVGGAKKTYHACMDTVTEYIRLAARGLVNASSTWYRCQCPKCFTPTATGTCEPKCDLATQCNEDFGCIIMPAADTRGGGGGSSKASSGVGAVGLVFIALASAGVTAMVVIAANRYLMRQRMGDEIRDIMAQYMPLHEQREREATLAAGGGVRRGGGAGSGGRVKPDSDSDEETGVGAYGWPAARSAPPPAGAASAGAPPHLAAAQQRAVWGPPPVNAAAASSQPRSSRSGAATASSPGAGRPEVNVFTIGAGADGGDGAGEPLGLPASGRAMSDADPLLGRELSGGLGGSSPTPDGDGAQGGSKPAGGDPFA